MWSAAGAWAIARAALGVARETAGTSTTAAPTCSAGSLSSEPATPGCCAAWCALAAASSAPFAAAASRFASASQPSCERDTTVKTHGPLIKGTLRLCAPHSMPRRHASETSHRYCGGGQFGGLSARMKYAGRVAGTMWAWSKLRDVIATLCR